MTPSQRHRLTAKERQLQEQVAAADAANPDAWRRHADDDVPMLYDETEDRGHDVAALFDDPEELDWEPNPVAPAHRRATVTPMTNYRAGIRARRVRRAA